MSSLFLYKMSQHNGELGLTPPHNFPFLSDILVPMCGQGSYEFRVWTQCNSIKFLFYFILSFIHSLIHTLVLVTHLQKGIINGHMGGGLLLVSVNGIVFKLN